MSQIPTEALASACFIFLLDQASKGMIRSRLVGCIDIGKFLRIRNVANRQDSFQSRRVRASLALLWISALTSAVMLHHWFSWFQNRGALIGIGVTFGGAAGNLVDVLRNRSITDFIDLRWWPVFNLADAAIVTGLCTAFLWPA